MISAYNSLITYNGSEWEDYLERLSFIDIFGGLIKEFPDKGDFTCVIKYIVYAYSVESDMVVIGQDWDKTKKKIFEKVMARPKEDMYRALVHLQNDKVLKAIEKWLQYQNNEVWETLQTAQDLRAEMKLSCLTPIKKSSGELDFDQKHKNLMYCIELRKTIKELESELIQNSVTLKEAVKEIREVKQKKSFGLETVLREE